mgnify:CR=1 FL=1
MKHLHRFVRRAAASIILKRTVVLTRCVGKVIVTVVCTRFTHFLNRRWKSDRCTISGIDDELDMVSLFQSHSCCTGCCF